MYSTKRSELTYAVAKNPPDTRIDAAIALIRTGHTSPRGNVA
jgi:hypothetical protein